jgi:hypothetical protein
MPPVSFLLADQSLFPLVIGAGIVLLGWYIVGHEVMRRRANGLAIWCKRSVDPFGGRQAVRWLSLQSFRLEATGPKAPVQSVAITGLVESWDVPMVWAWNRLHHRRDMVLLELSLRQPPAWGMELYRPGTMLAGDARHIAQHEGWPDESLQEFRLAPADSPRRALAERLLSDLGSEREHLIRLAVRRTGPHLALFLNVPDRSRLSPQDFHRLVQRLVDTTARFALPVRE